MTDEIPEDVVKAVIAFFEAMANWNCPICRGPVQEEEQIGRCVYAKPCGHRLRQGESRGSRPESED